jgi:hypothetical protein
MGECGAEWSGGNLGKSGGIGIKNIRPCPTLSAAIDNLIRSSAAVTVLQHRVDGVLLNIACT